MHGKLLARIIAGIALALVFTGTRAKAQNPSEKNQLISPFATPPLSLSLATTFESDLLSGGFKSFPGQQNNTDNSNDGAKSHDYREISDFFNVREANVNTVAGEWELELEDEWVTGNGGDDDFDFTPNLKFGLNDDMFIEVEVLPLRIGDGSDQGNGDFAVQLFDQFSRETERYPAVAAWIEGRFPTGEGSSGVDGELHLNLTKTLVPDVRGHLEGFAKTANGGRGDEDNNRRAFQWGAGIGVDYRMDARTICTVNYVNRSNEEYGASNQQVIEVGGVRQIAEDQHIKVAVDVGLNEDTPDFGAKILWSIEW